MAVVTDGSGSGRLCISVFGLVFLLALATAKRSGNRPIQIGLRETGRSVALESRSQVPNMIEPVEPDHISGFVSNRVTF